MLRRCQCNRNRIFRSNSCTHTPDAYMQEPRMQRKRSRLLCCVLKEENRERERKRKKPETLIRLFCTHSVLQYYTVRLQQFIRLFVFPCTLSVYTAYAYMYFHSHRTIHVPCTTHPVPVHPHFSIHSTTHTMSNTFYVTIHTHTRHTHTATSEQTQNDIGNVANISMCMRARARDEKEQSERDTERQGSVKGSRTIERKIEREMATSPFLCVSRSDVFVDSVHSALATQNAIAKCK